MFPGSHSEQMNSTRLQRTNTNQPDNWKQYVRIRGMQGPCCISVDVFDTAELWYTKLVLELKTKGTVCSQQLRKSNRLRSIRGGGSNRSMTSPTEFGTKILFSEKLKSKNQPTGLLSNILSFVTRDELTVNHRFSLICICLQYTICSVSQPVQVISSQINLSGWFKYKFHQDKSVSNAFTKHKLR